MLHSPSLFPVFLSRNMSPQLSHLPQFSTRVSWYVIVHSDILDLEDIILLWWANAPAGISIRPIIPDPRSRDCRNVGREGLLKNAVKEEHGLIGGPVYAIFVQRGYVSGCGSSRMRVLAAFNDGLIGILEPGRLFDALSGRIGQGGFVGEVFKVNFLLVGVVEEVSLGQCKWRCRKTGLGK